MLLKIFRTYKQYKLIYLLVHKISTLNYKGNFAFYDKCLSTLDLENISEKEISTRYPHWLHHFAPVDILNHQNKSH